jgi:hypothetical protein
MLPCAVPSVLLWLMAVLVGSHADEAASPAAAAHTCSRVLAKVRHSLSPGADLTEIPLRFHRLDRRF